MKINKWQCHSIEADFPLTCPACGDPIPKLNVVNGDCCYLPIWSDDFDPMEGAIRASLDIKDPFAEFFLCQTCFMSLNVLPPLMWLAKWIEEDSKMINREKALKSLERIRKWKRWKAGNASQEDQAGYDENKVAKETTTMIQEDEKDEDKTANIIWQEWSEGGVIYRENLPAHTLLHVLWDFNTKYNAENVLLDWLDENGWAEEFEEFLKMNYGKGLKGEAGCS